MKHDLYKTGDADAPAAILDRNGEVVLSLCRNCKRGEIDLKNNIECDGWARWKGGGPPPKKWYATNPQGESVLVYRSYEDYCMD
jgi:hypothetical protein